MAFKLDHITLLFTSPELSWPYYETLLPLLGFTQEKREIWHDGAGFYFQFMKAKAGTAAYERYGAGMNHLGFEAPDAATVERVRDAMAAAGFEVPEIQKLGGATALFMKDPDGIRFEITYYAPGTPVVD